MRPAEKLATYDDLLAMPEDVRAEILRGTIVTVPAPLPQHSKPQGALRGFVGRPFDDDDGAGGPGGWWIFLEVDVRFTIHDVLRPDLAGWRRERLPQPNVRPIDVVPDWICEVLSPSTSVRDRVDKKRLYAQHGVKHYWLVDPEARIVEALELEHGRWVDAGTFAAPDVARIPPFEAVEIPLARVFLPRDEGADG